MTVLALRAWSLESTAMSSMAGLAELPSSAEGKIKSFQVHVPDEDIADLKTLLSHSRIGPQIYENGLHGGRLGLRQ
jgi:hypothetical protein